MDAFTAESHEDSAFEDAPEAVVRRSMDDRFADAFRLARQSSGLSQSDVAFQMADFGYEMAQPVIGKIERGERRVSIGEGEALSAIVGQSTSTLLNGVAFVRLEVARVMLERRREEMERAEERFEEAELELELAQMDVAAQKRQEASKKMRYAAPQDVRKFMDDGDLAVSAFVDAFGDPVLVVWEDGKYAIIDPANAERETNLDSRMGGWPWTKLVPAE